MIKKWIYKLGFRPKPGTLFYSPSLDLTYFLRDELHKSYNEEMNKKIFLGEGTAELQGITPENRTVVAFRWTKSDGEVIEIDPQEVEIIYGG